MQPLLTLAADPSVVPRRLKAWMYRTVGKAVRPYFALPTAPLSTICNPQESCGDPIKDGICLPPYHETKNHDDFGALMAVVTALRPETVLELGTAYGNTVANICRACPSARVFTVNAPPEEISGDVITYALSKNEIGRVYRQYGFSERVVQIWCNTLKLDLAQYLRPGTVNLAIVDACHDYKYVINDFLKVVPFIRSGGIVLLHDTHPSLKGHLWGSYTACMMLRRRGYEIRHIEGTWWGIWVNTAKTSGDAGHKSA